MQLLLKCILILYPLAIYANANQQTQHIQIQNTAQFQEYLKLKETHCEKIRDRFYIPFMYDCDRLDLSIQAQSECYAELHDIMDHLVSYCNYQETYHDFIRRLR